MGMKHHVLAEVNLFDCTRYEQKAPMSIGCKPLPINPFFVSPPPPEALIEVRERIGDSSQIQGRLVFRYRVLEMSQLRLEPHEAKWQCQ